MVRTIAIGVLATLAMVGAVQAQPVAYTWSGLGTGSGKCSTYKMTINVTVDGTAVKGLFKQDGREERHFEATAGAGGVFKTKAVVGNGGSMDVTGTIKDGDSKVLLDGYCKFDAKLTKKS